MKRLEITIGQGCELLALARRLTPDEYQTRHRWLERITSPEFNLDAIAVKESEVIDLGSGWIFTPEDLVELEVDDSTEPDEILRRGGHDPVDWEYLGSKPAPGVRKVRAAIGRLNRPWTEEGLAEFLAKPGCPMRGSGAWVREAFLKVRPRYDGGSGIGFPDSKTSRWRDRDDGYVCFPYLWYDGAYWYRGLYSVRSEWNAERRVCLLFAE